MTNFSSQVIACIQKIPKGKVATYGQIAALAGKPHGSRGVAWILNSSSQTHKLPWHRVVNSKGKISFPKMSSHYVKQKRLLAKEGIQLNDRDLIELKKYQWKRKPQEIKRKIKMF